MCGELSEVKLEAQGEAASQSVQLTPNDTKPLALCSLKVTAPKSHVVNLQFLEVLDQGQLNETEANKDKKPSCFMSIVSSGRYFLTIWTKRERERCATTNYTIAKINGRKITKKKWLTIPLLTKPSPNMRSVQGPLTHLRISNFNSRCSEFLMRSPPRYSQPIGEITICVVTVFVQLNYALIAPWKIKCMYYDSFDVCQCCIPWVASAASKFPAIFLVVSSTSSSVNHLNIHLHRTKPLE